MESFKSLKNQTLLPQFEALEASWFNRGAKTDDMDDFGDLYADLDCHLSAGIGTIPGLNQSFTRDGDKTESLPYQADSVSKEFDSYQFGENEERLTVSNGKGMPGSDEEISNNSDSDNDFHIVLNEEDCPKFQSSKGVNLGNGGMVLGGSDDENESDDLVILAGSDHLNYDQKWTDQFPSPADGLMQGSEEKGYAAKNNGHLSWHVGSHLAGFPNCARTSISGRGDWDQLMTPCFGGAASYDPDISAAAQNGVGFSLPRNRTIFDINIEAFEQKPWRYHGVDMTDYFNFGLDEESWKSYCEHLDHFKQQATIAIRFPFYQSSRLYQGERNSSMLENVEKGGRGFDMPKGRAIQVEGSLGERIPSTDIRRLRHRDSDVVIQITMEGSVEDSSKNSVEHVEGQVDASLSNSWNKSNERMLSPHHAGQIYRDITNLVDYHSPDVNETTFIRTEEVKSKVDCENEEDPLRTDACMLDVGSASSDQVPHSSSFRDLESHSKESKDVSSLEKEFKPIKKMPLRSVSGSRESDCYLSNDSRSDATKTELEDRKDNTHESNLSFGEHKHFSQAKLQSVAELNVAEDKEQASNLAHRKHQSDVDLWDISCKTRERKSSYGTDVRGHLLSYRETEMSPSYKSRKYTPRHGYEKPCTKDSRKGDHGTHLTRNRDEEDCLKQRECYFSERCHEDRGTRGFVHKDSDQSISKHKSFFREKDSCLRLAKERGDERRIRMETECDDLISDNRYRKRCVQEMHRRHVPSCDMEEDIFDLKFGRHVYPTTGEIRSPERRNRNDRRSCFDLNRSSKRTNNDAKNCRHLDHRLLVSHTYREPSTTDERDWHDAGSPRNHLPISWRSSKRYVYHRKHHNIRELQFKNKKYGCVVPSIYHHRHSSYENGLESDTDEYISEGKDVYLDNIVSFNQVRRHNLLSKPRLRTDDGVRFRHREQGGSSSPQRSLCERSSRHENIHVNQPSVSGQTFPVDRQLNSAGKKTVAEGSFDFGARDRVNFVSDISNKGKHELAAVGCREAVNIRLNGWKGKLARRGAGVASESERQIDTGYRIDNKPKNSRHPKKGYKQEEVHPQILKGDGGHNFQTSLKADKVKDSKSSNFDDHTKISLDKHPISQDVEDGEIEEGELIEESDIQAVVSVTLMDRSSEKKVENFQSKDSSCNEKIVGIYDSNHILQTLAKMEKRKERFKEPIAPKQGPEKTVNSQLDGSLVTDEAKQQRPARKRHWGGS